MHRVAGQGSQSCRVERSSLQDGIEVHDSLGMNHIGPVEFRYVRPCQDESSFLLRQGQVVGMNSERFQWTQSVG